MNTDKAQKQSGCCKPKDAFKDAAAGCCKTAPKQDSASPNGPAKSGPSCDCPKPGNC